MKQLKLGFNYQWKPAFINGKQQYFFPERITSFMKKKYGHPAVYCWNIYKSKPGDKKIIYIGETQTLCPQRINGYLKPGPSQQTNKRIKGKFQEYINKGLKIRLEILQFNKIAIGKSIFTFADLTNKHLRRFIEEFMVIYCQQKRYKVLNL